MFCRLIQVHVLGAELKALRVISSMPYFELCSIILILSVVLLMQREDAQRALFSSVHPSHDDPGRLGIQV